MDIDLMERYIKGRQNRVILLAASLSGGDTG
jgi:hypothetical protein